MAFPYEHILMIGATAGIGKAMADRLIEEGFKVTAVGRRKDRLDEFVSKHGESKAKAFPFDIGNVEQIPEFVSDITRLSPDIDCIFLNAGIQRTYDFSKPEKVDLAEFNLEMHINFTSIVALVHGFLPFLMSKKSPTSIIFTGAKIAVVPASMLSGYSASKGALNIFTLCLRDQLRHSNIKVIEVSPPLVQTELHDYMGEEAGRKLGMPLDEFTEQAYRGLAAGHDQIMIGSVVGCPPEVFNDIIEKRRAASENLSKIMRGGKP